MFFPEPRRGIMDISPYVGGESAIPGVDRVIKLSSNEGALGASPLAVEAYRRAAGDLHRYPDGGCARLRQAIAARHDLDPTRIVCGAGSDELIGLLCHAYAGSGDEVVYSQYGFLMYAIYAKSAGATPVTAPETNLTANVDALLAAVTPRTRVMFLANPNNPTGTYLPAGEVWRLRRSLPENVLLVIDAAYAEFVERDDYSPGVDLVDASSGNTVMTRTFSKIHALGGLRLGWAYCPSVIADVLNRVRSPFNVNSAAQEAGAAAIADAPFTEMARAHNNIWLPWLGQALEALGLEVVPSVCNFLLVQFPNQPHSATAADRFLQSRGIIARRVAGYGLPDALRITIGREDEMRATVAALAEFLG
ncbi:MAG: histidinol-phosphate transaminase [Alphaproteobacteria bacterium]|nr:histidinol-phosphate transaminase [Alphaproteobacteria bacterium]